MKNWDKYTRCATKPAIPDRVIPSADQEREKANAILVDHARERP